MEVFGCVQLKGKEHETCQLQGTADLWPPTLHKAETAAPADVGLLWGMRGRSVSSGKSDLLGNPVRESTSFVCPIPVSGRLNRTENFASLFLLIWKAVTCYK